VRGGQRYVGVCYQSDSHQSTVSMCPAMLPCIL
jgi:hypothetical protein